MGLEQLEEKVHELGGLFVPAHIDRMRNGIIAQLGFIPPALKCDALEVSPHSSPPELIRQYSYLKDYAFLRGSDAHYPDDIGLGRTRFYLAELSWEEISLAMKGIGERKMELI